MGYAAMTLAPRGRAIVQARASEAKFPMLIANMSKHPAARCPRGQKRTSSKKSAASGLALSAWDTRAPRHQQQGQGAASVQVH
jgi:hypothetical protein